jgi:TusA-related sulfurtransferase
MKNLEINGEKIKVETTIDAVGLYCPTPIILLTKALDGLKSHQVVEVLADDTGFQKDVGTWCMQTNNRLLSVSKNEENIFVAYVEKT